MAWERADLDEARCRLHNDIFDVVLWAVEDKNFVLIQEGDAYALNCPCGRGAPFIRVDGFPTNPSWKADRLRRSVNLCPDQHDVLPQ
jgi:hypothetical protein